ncbi:hypothetical protein ACYE2N_09500 [Flavobacterium sp. MAHUQ-51]|uniref:hypothetical protein n=1 Tax=Flavobacterium sp. GCM10022190 TaxID=3252639 RepID=UPI00361D483E
MKKRNNSIILIIFLLTSCIGAGTLGGFDLRTFPVSKRKIVLAIDTLYKHYPEYKIPDKWKIYDDWHKRGYDFLDSRIFYFKKYPEEMYYVTFYGDANDSIQVDTTKTSLSIRTYHNEQFNRWIKEENCNSKEKKRIQKRFDEEIISKVELYLNSKVIIEK